MCRPKKKIRIVSSRLTTDMNGFLRRECCRLRVTRSEFIRVFLWKELAQRLKAMEASL
ncbi:MAG: hypothetical protein HYS81_01895 [Candidatus Aenigmatarchaeota archaeon]|nr:MAG: hypothetical protein HYS81_01895 [Candidatus Aenigmarchaeota archaeon]